MSGAGPCLLLPLRVAKPVVHQAELEEEKLRRTWVRAGSILINCKCAKNTHMREQLQRTVSVDWGSKGYLNLWEMGMGFEVRGQHWQGPGCWGCLLCIRRNSRCYCILPSRGRGILTWLLGYMTSSSGQIRGYREACRPGVGEQLTPANLRMRFPRFDPILAPDLFPQSHDFS